MEDETWDEIEAHGRELATRFEALYRKVADERGPSSAEVSDALEVLTRAGRHLAETITETLAAAHDPEVADHVIDSLLGLMGASATEVRK